MTEEAISPVVEREAVGDPYSLLFLYADSLNDIEKLRIATQNRHRALTEEKGLAGTPEAERLFSYLEDLKTLENQSVKELERVMKTHPLIGCIEAVKGMGRKQVARLLAATGDPGERENVAKLWAYCGFHVIQYCPECGNLLEQLLINEDDESEGKYLYCKKCDVERETFVGEAPRLRRGVTASWNTKARMRTILVAESCIKKMDSPLRPIYDEGRLKHKDAVNHEGKPLTDLHKHNRARRLVAKKVLLLLWIEAKHVKGELEYSARDFLVRNELISLPQ